MDPEVLAHGVVERFGAAVPDPARRLRERLLGPALVRLSAARWGGGLSLALRLREQPVLTPGRAPGDQDFVFVSRALFRPRVADYLAVDYVARTAHELEGEGRFHLKLVTCKPTPLGGTRRERLQTALWDDDAHFVLHARRWPGGRWMAFARLRLEAFLPAPPEEMRVDVRAGGRGLRPVGRWALLTR
jgi:hypothetical protein